MRDPTRTIVNVEARGATMKNEVRPHRLPAGGEHAPVDQAEEIAAARTEAKRARKLAPERGVLAAFCNVVHRTPSRIRSRAPARASSTKQKEKHLSSKLRAAR